VTLRAVHRWLLPRGEGFYAAGNVAVLLHVRLSLLLQWRLHRDATQHT